MHFQISLPVQTKTSAFFTVAYGVRQGSVLAPFLFAVYLDNLCEMCSFDRGRFIIVYADDILLLSPSVMDFEKLVHLCERELIRLDMTISAKKSCCLRIGPRCDVEWANLTTLSGHVLSWTKEIRYLGIFIIQSRTFKCALYAKSCFLANSRSRSLYAIARPSVVCLSVCRM